MRASLEHVSLFRVGAAIQSVDSNNTLMTIEVFSQSFISVADQLTVAIHQQSIPSLSMADEYGTDLEMVKSALKAFFTLYWSSKYSDRVLYGMMSGTYNAQAVMRIETRPAGSNKKNSGSFAHSLRGAVSDLADRMHDSAVQEERKERQELPCEDQVVPIRPRYCPSGCSPKDVRGFRRSLGYKTPPELDVFAFHVSAVERFRAHKVTSFFQTRCKGRVTPKEFYTVLTMTADRWQSMTLKHLKATPQDIPHVTLKIELDVKKPFSSTTREGGLKEAIETD